MPLAGYFPNVPDLPGVPQIPRTPGAVINTILSILAPAQSGTLWQSAPQVPVWGIYDQDGNQVLDPDSIIDFSNRNEWNVVSSPIQRGAFASYNKVVVPFELSVRMTKGGTVDDRSDFINAIANIAGDTNLYDILTPELLYEEVNITRYEVSRRGAAGAYFLAEVDVFFVQILQVTPQYTNTSLVTQNAQDPAAQPAVNQGSLPANGVSALVGQSARDAISQFQGTQVFPPPAQ